MMNAAAFPIERRPAGDEGHRMQAKIRCSVCFREDFATVNGSAGWAGHVFKQRGWLLGRSRGTDVCPGCRRQKPAMAGLSTPARRRAAYLAIEDRKAAAMGSTALSSSLAAHKDEPPGPMAEALAPLLERMKDQPQEDEMMVAPTAPEQPVNLWRGGYSSPESAATQAGVALKSQTGRTHRRDVDFEIGATPDQKYAWRLKGSDGPEGFELIRCSAHGGRRASARLSPQADYSAGTPARRAAEELLKRLGISEPKEGVHFVIEGRDNHRFGFRLLGTLGAPAAAQPEPPPPDQRRPVVKVDWEAVAEREAALGLPPSPPREMTREDRRRLRDQLDEVYLPEEGRYRGDLSDAKLAERLQMPRAWVERMRVEDYGDFDRNEVAEKQVADLDAAIASAKAAVDSLLDGAAKAEGELQKLEALRRRLGGA
jgi:hypothetical protein